MTMDVTNNNRKIELKTDAGDGDGHHRRQTEIVPTATKTAKRPFDVAFLMQPDDKSKRQLKVTLAAPYFATPTPPPPQQQQQVRRRRLAESEEDEDDDDDDDEEADVEIECDPRDEQQRRRTVDADEPQPYQPQKSAFTKVSLGKEARRDLSLSPDVGYQNSSSPSPPMTIAAAAAVRNTYTSFAANLLAPSAAAAGHLLKTQQQQQQQQHLPPAATYQNFAQDYALEGAAFANNVFANAALNNPALTSTTLANSVLANSPLASTAFSGAFIKAPQQSQQQQQQQELLLQGANFKMRPLLAYRPDLPYNYAQFHLQEMLKITQQQQQQQHHNHHNNPHAHAHPHHHQQQQQQQQGDLKFAQDLRTPAAAAAILQSLLPPSLAALSLPAQNVCAKCNVTFRMTSDLVYHMRSHHKNDSLDFGGRKRREDKLKCPVCAESFRERHHLTRHMTAHQDKDNEEFEGEACAAAGKKGKAYLFGK